jgi:hypothetical protein
LKTFSDAEMDAAVLKFRQMKDAEEYYRELAESPRFKEGLEAAFARDPSFFTVDAAGWRPPQFCVDVPPAPPKVNGAPEPDWTERERRKKPIPGAAFPS